MALLVRLRQALLRSSSIPKCCSFSDIAPDSSHLINLSKPPFPAESRLQNPSIRPTPSNHDCCPPSTSLKIPKDDRQPGTKIPKDEFGFPKFSKTSPEEMIVTCFQTLAKVLGSFKDAKAVEEMSDKCKKSVLEMIEQLKGACMRETRSVEDAKEIEEISAKLKISCLEIIELLKDMLGFVRVSPDLDIDCENNKFEGDKCENEVTTARLPSPLVEYKNQLSVEDMEIINEMSEKLTKYIEVLEKLKAMHGFTSHSPEFYSKNKRYKDYIEKAKAECIPRERWLSEERFDSIDEFVRFKAIHGPNWRSHVSYEHVSRRGDKNKDPNIERRLPYRRRIIFKDATEHSTTHTAR